MTVPDGELNIYRLVEADLRGRERVGTAEYGAPLHTGTPIDALEYAYDETLDKALYLRLEIERRRRCVCRCTCTPGREGNL